MLFEGNHDLPRLFSVLKEDVGLTKMALAYVMTMPRVPQLYYGTEMLMTSPDGARRRQGAPGLPRRLGRRQGRRVHRQGPQRASRRTCRPSCARLLNWRKTQTTVHHGKLMHFVPENGTYAWFRYDADSTVMVVINKNATETELGPGALQGGAEDAGQARDVLAGKASKLGATVKLPPRSVRSSRCVDRLR